MSPLTVGAGVAAVMAGPTLYTLVEHGQLDGTSAIARGLLVAAVCAVAASYLQGMIKQFDLEVDRKHAARMRLLAEAEAVQRAKAEAEAKAAANQAQQNQANQRFNG